MILLERISALGQENNQSHAIISSRQRNQNPALIVTQEGGNLKWTFTGLQMGEIQEVDPNNPRRNHVDAYIGMDDLAIYMDQFPSTNAEPAGTYNGLRIPVGSERAGGTKIRWKGALVRSLISEFEVVIPPIKLLRKRDDDVILNLDRETSRYPIDNGNGKTTLESHFGINHDFQIKRDNRVKVGRIDFLMEPEHYSTILHALEDTVEYYVDHLQNY
jgi:hypothetical protein